MHMKLRGAAGSCIEQRRNTSHHQHCYGAGCVVTGIVRGGLGIHLPSELALSAYLASIHSAEVLRKLIVPHIDDNDRAADATLAWCAQTELGVPPNPKIQKSEGHHGLSCNAIPAGRNSRHSALNDVIKRALASASIPSILEPPGLDREGGKKPHELTMVLGSRTCLVWDVTCWDTMATSNIADTMTAAVGTAVKAEQRKTQHYKLLIGLEKKPFEYHCQRISIEIQRGNALPFYLLILFYES
ncbi:hypothetical protein BV898_08473 [Hypsibius exemplaris]|uniref:Uncharacterized protein n=1 Tax=Hypsibius exemplaris TaxID=2072580 RepID=A0A1W0WQ89_HYPEX|nr:hypothetical protein BV898_08473 [Hypsibius exemplaris]